MCPSEISLSKKSKLRCILRYISLVFCVFEDPKNKHICVIYFIFYWTINTTYQLQGVWNRLLLTRYLLLSIIIIEMSFRIILFLTNFLMSLDILFLKTRKMNEISLIIERFEESYTKYQTEIARNRRRFLFISTLILASITFAYITNFIENQGIMGSLNSKAFGPLFLLVIQTAVLVTNVCAKLNDIGTCLKILNREMYQTMMHSYPWVIIGNANTRIQQFFGFIHAYNELFTALTMTNSVHSFHFLMLLLSNTIMVLHICNLFVKYAYGVLPVGGNIWKMTSIFSLVTTYIVFCVLLTYVCDDVVKQEKDTLDIAYKLLINLRGELGQEEQCIKEYLMLFAEQIHGRNFRFTAWGLFNVDLTALFMILGSIAMYLIMIPIQF